MLRRYLLLILVLLTAFVGCAGSKAFIAPGFTGQSLTEGGIAIFPVLVGEGSTGAPGIQSYLRPAGEELAASLRKSQPTLKIVGPSQVGMTLANEDLVDDFAKLKQSYALTGMVDVKTAQKIVEPLKVKYFMLASITSLFAADESTAKAVMSAKIFDSAEGQLVFETLGGGKDISIFGGPPYQKAVKRATESLSRSLMVVYKQK